MFEFNTSFEIFDGGDIVRIEPLPSKNNNAAIDWDKNWLRAKVTVKGSVFSGQFAADFMTADFELFKRELTNLDKNLNGTGNFNPLKGQLSLTVTGDGLGHFDVKCTACDNPNYGGKLAFSLSFDQTELPRLINELDQITKAFPIQGHLNIKNE